MVDGRKIETKGGQILYDSNWIVGVDYIDNNANNNCSENEETANKTDSVSEIETEIEFDDDAYDRWISGYSRR